MKNKLSKMRLCDWVLIGLTIVTLASSIQLEFTHCTSVSWVWSHVIISTTFIVLIGWHLYLHFQRRNWVKMLKVQKSPITRLLGIICLLTIISAIIAFLQWINVYSHTIAGGIHGKIGFLFIAICIAHTIKRIKSPILKKSITLIVLLIAAFSTSAVAAGSPWQLFKGKGNTKKVENTAKVKTLDSREKQILESVKQRYSQGKISADSVVNLALYHKVGSPQLAEQCLKLVSDANTRAKTELGLLYTHFTTAYLFPGKAPEGEQLLTDAANAGNNDAYDYLGIYYHLNKKYKKARECFEARGHKNNGMALCIIGGMYEDGTGYKKSAKTACDYYRQSALTGYANGATKYAYSLQRPWFGNVSLPDAFFWFYVAGDMGNDAARSNLWLPLTGERYGDDLSTLLAQKSLAMVEKGHEGQSFSGEPLYKDGFLKGIKDREKAAEGGDDWSRFYLGSMNYNDDFLNRNYERALSYYEQIAKNGSLPAPLMAVVYERLGDMYRNGKGVKANVAKADKYTHMAANLGSLKAYKTVEGIKN